MNMSAFAQFPWLPWALIVAGLLAVALLVLAIRARRRWSKALLALGVVLVVSGSLAGLGVASRYQPRPRLANLPAPVPDALSLSFMYYADKPGVQTSTLITLNAHTGTVRAQSSFTGIYYRYSVADDHILYLVGATTTFVTAVQMSDGNELWRTSLFSPAHPEQRLVPDGRSILADGMLYLTTREGFGQRFILGLNASTGAVVWNFPVPGMDFSPNTGVLAARQGMVFVEGPTDNFSVLRSSDGERMWNIGLEPGEPLAGFPIFAGGVVYIITNLQSGPNQAVVRRIVALDGHDANELWSHPLGGQIATLTPDPVGVGASSIYLEGTEFVGNHDEHYLYSVSIQTGNVQWKYPITVTGSATVSATEANNLVYVATSNDPYLDAVRVSDGQRVWRHNASASVGFSAPVVADGVLFVKSLLFNGSDVSTNPCQFHCEPLTAVYALDAATGSLYWHSAWSSLDASVQPWVTTDTA